MVDSGPRDGRPGGTHLDRPTVIRAENLSKVFSPRGREPLTALCDASLDVECQEFVALLGPSGCGKTTLLRMVQGLETPTTGSLMVSLDGEPAPYNAGTQMGIAGSIGSGESPRIGFVFQHARLLPWLTVSENVKFGLSVKAMKDSALVKDADRRVQRLLELTGLASFGNYRPAELSGGMQQRVNLARALAIEPHILLMDEPFSALDAMTRSKLQRDLLAIVAEVNTTVLFVTHDIREAVYLADRVVLMAGGPGRIIDIERIEEPRPRSGAYQQSEDLTARTRVLTERLRAAGSDNSSPPSSAAS